MGQEGAALAEEAGLGERPAEGADPREAGTGGRGVACRRGGAVGIQSLGAPCEFAVPVVPVTAWGEGTLHDTPRPRLQGLGSTGAHF